MSDEATKEYKPDVPLDMVVNEWIAKSVLFHKGNMVEAAKSLRISRAKLYRWFDKISDAKGESDV